MKLTSEQLERIKELSSTVVTTRAQLAEGLCEALGEEWTWSTGYVNGNGNSIVLHHNNAPVQINTYRFADGVAIKFIDMGDYAYYFDKLGVVKYALRRYEEKVDDGFVRRIEVIS